MLKQRQFNLKDDDSGAALTEMAIILPFLLALGCGIFEFATFFYQYQLVASGVRDAGRYMSRVTDTTSASPCGAGGCLTPCDPAVLTAKEPNAKKIAVWGKIQPLGIDPPRVSWWAEADVAIAYSVTANPLISGYPSYRGPLSGIRTITVSTTATYPGVGFLSMLGLGSSMTVNLNHQERCIGQG